MPDPQGTLWTIGHSTRSFTSFAEQLEVDAIRMVVDVRARAFSGRAPWTNPPGFAEKLAEMNIRYLHLPELGGRRSPRADSPHTALRQAAFRGFADHMDTPAFADALGTVETLARTFRLTLMCAEADRRQCHRNFIADRLVLRGWTVLHISAKGTEPHVRSPQLHEVNGRMIYGPPGLF